MNVIGISAFYHESACCLIQDGRLVAAASEERFTRVKYDPRLPVEAFRFCLRKGGLDITDIDLVAYYESPVKKLGRQLWAGVPDRSDDDFSWLDPGQPVRAIRERLGFEGTVELCEHHLSHAASAFYFSGFPDAAVLTVDGVGEWATTTYGHGLGACLELFEEVHFPHSLGLLYATLTAYLGFRVNDGEYKVMGLAPYGTPRFLDQMRQLVSPGPKGQYRLNMAYFDFVRGDRMYSQQLCALFGGPARRPESELTRFHFDVAKSLQTVLEEILLEKVAYLAERVPVPNLCMAGGVALNCVANGRIRRESRFERLFVQPAAGDAGGCLGAAAWAYLKHRGQAGSITPMTHVHTGPSFDPEDVALLLEATAIRSRDYRGKESELLEETARRLRDRQVVGWFHGSMEFGPRALGARSILANPLDPEIRDRLNRMVKKRESFRPFAPSVLEDHAAAHFELDRPSPYMLETCKVRSPLQLPGITHVDGSARPQTVDAAQNPRYAALLEKFDRLSGCPILVNTSFNMRDEPIVCTPVDALFCMAHAGLDALVLEDFLIDRTDLPANWSELLPAWRSRQRTPFQKRRSALSEHLYTFV